MALQSSKRLNQSLMVLARILVSFKEIDLSTWATASAGVYNLPTCHLGSWYQCVTNKQWKISKTKFEWKLKELQKFIKICTFFNQIRTYLVWKNIFCFICCFHFELRNGHFVFTVSSVFKYLYSKPWIFTFRFCDSLCNNVAVFVIKWNRKQKQKHFLKPNRP